MIGKSQKKAQDRGRRHTRIRARVAGSAERPRLSVFKSHKFIYAQVIDDAKGMTLASASSKDAKGKTMLERAKETGSNVAKAAGAKKVGKVVFDRGGFAYKGAIAALADGAREGGLEF